MLPSGNFNGQTQVFVGVDTTACRTGAVQCSAFGAPANGNRVPVAVKFQVLDSAGLPVTALGASNVTISTSFVPAGGGALQIRSCTNCFQNAGNGVYGFWIEPFGSTTWKSGTYFIQVQVRNGSVIARGLTEVAVPF